MILTIEEILDLTTHDNFEKFCEDYGYDVWVVKEGGGHIQVGMTCLEAEKYGIIKKRD